MLINWDVDMNLEDIKALAALGESNDREYKATTNKLSNACETLCAFLNADGGHVLIGVKDDGQLIGQEVTDKTKCKIGNEIAKITPVPDIEITHVTLPNSNKAIIALHAKPENNKKPYLYNNRAYMRLEAITATMPREYYHHLLHKNGVLDLHGFGRGSYWALSENQEKSKADNNARKTHKDARKTQERRIKTQKDASTLLPGCFWVEITIFEQPITL